MKIFAYGSLLGTFLLACTQEVLIITHNYNSPLFIEWQHRSFKAHLKDKFRFVVFNDANNDKMHDAIAQTCQKLGIECVRVPQIIHDLPYLPRFEGDNFHRPNIRHCNALQYSMNKLGFFHDGIVFIIDSDMFMSRSMSISQLMENTDIVAVLRSGGEKVLYLWAGFMILNMKRIPNKQSLIFNCGPYEDEVVDSGGYTANYLRLYPKLQIKGADEIFSWQIFCPDRFAGSRPRPDIQAPVQEKISSLAQRGFNEQEINFILKKPDTIHFVCDKTFLHFRAGTNYDNQADAYMKNKMTMINEFLLSTIR